MKYTVILKDENGKEFDTEVDNDVEPLGEALSSMVQDGMQIRAVEPVADKAELEKELPTPAGSFARSMGRGAFLGFSDEIAGVFSPEAKEELRIKEKLDQAVNPKASLAGDVVGGFATSALIPAVAANAAPYTKASQLARVAEESKLGKTLNVASDAYKANPYAASTAQSAIEGALSGVGESNTMEDAPLQAFLNSVLGAGGATLGNAVSRGGKKIINLPEEDTAFMKLLKKEGKLKDRLETAVSRQEGISKELPKLKEQAFPAGLEVKSRAESARIAGNLDSFDSLSKDRDELKQVIAKVESEYLDPSSKKTKAEIDLELSNLNSQLSKVNEKLKAVRPVQMEMGFVSPTNAAEEANYQAAMDALYKAQTAKSSTDIDVGAIKKELERNGIKIQKHWKTPDIIAAFSGLVAQKGPNVYNQATTKEDIAKQEIYSLLKDLDRAKKQRAQSEEMAAKRKQNLGPLNETEQERYEREARELYQEAKRKGASK